MNPVYDLCLQGYFTAASDTLIMKRYSPASYGQHGQGHMTVVRSNVLTCFSDKLQKSLKM